MFNSTSGNLVWCGCQITVAVWKRPSVKNN